MGASAKSSPQPVSGLRLPERYEVLRHIATGGMASVWCAEDLVLGRTVAIKVLAERFTHDEFAVLRFQREARAAARVSAHPHVVTIFDVGDIEPSTEGDGNGPAPVRAFIVMEHLTGGTVADALRVDEVTRLEALRWLGEAASALDHAHARGIVHRDIKPANFLLDGGRNLHVADFGIARLLSEDTITSSGELFGTASYLAPEQALGREATGASDRYALAVAAFELLTGERPFKATHFAAQARQHIEDEPPSASERNRALPSAVDPVLVRGMAKRPEDRYDTAGGFVEALQGALDSEATAVTQRLAERRRPLAVPVVGAAPARASATRAASTSRRPTIPPRRPPRPRLAAASGRDGTAPVAPVSPGSERPRGRVLALLALLALTVAALAVVLAGVLGNGGSKPRASLRASTGHAAARGARTRHRPKRTATTPAGTAASSSASTTTTSSASATATTAASSSTPPTGASAADLQTLGHQLMLNGSYPAAITALRRAVSAADPSSLTYAYALYDLGRSLTLSGNPQAAIPILQQRLRIPNQTPVVQQALNQALQAAGQSPGSGQSPASSQSQTTPSAGAGAPAPTSGGAGIAHGRGHGHGNGQGGGD